MISPDFYRGFQMLSPEAVTIAVGRASMTIRNVDVATGTHVVDVDAEVEVLGVAWTATGLRSGYRIQIAYSVVRYQSYPPLGYDPPPLLETGMILPGYLEWNGCAYQPAARAASFDDLSMAAMSYPVGLEAWARDATWRRGHPGYGQPYPGPRPGSSGTSAPRGRGWFTQLLGA